jgi:hypothetical protein
MPNPDTRPVPSTGILKETVVYFSRAANLPGKPSKAVLVNWKDDGLQVKRSKRRPPPTVRLEYAYLGGQLVTSLEAYDRFQRRVNGEEA